MNYLRPNPTGIDKAIDDIQTRLYNRLGFSGIDGYGRVYPIFKDDKKPIPAFFITGNDYRDVLFDDSANGNFFFYEEPDSEKVNSIEMESKLQIIFQLDINKIYQDEDHRNDEKARIKIEGILRNSGFTVETVTRGITSLKDFDHNLRDRKLCFFNFKGNIRYQINC